MSIHDMSLQEQSLLFAELASLAYGDEKQVKKDAKGFGFTKVKFYDIVEKTRDLMIPIYKNIKYD